MEFGRALRYGPGRPSLWEALAPAGERGRRVLALPGAGGGRTRPGGEQRPAGGAAPRRQMAPTRRVIIIISAWGGGRGRAAQLRKASASVLRQPGVQSISALRTVGGVTWGSVMRNTCSESECADSVLPSLGFVTTRRHYRWWGGRGVRGGLRERWGIGVVGED